MVQLTVEQRTFLVKKVFETGSLEVTRHRFAERFPVRRPSTLKAIRANVRKFSAHGTTLNRNNGNSGRHRTGTSDANIKAVRVRLAEHPFAFSFCYSVFVLITHRGENMRLWPTFLLVSYMLNFFYLVLK